MGHSMGGALVLGYPTRSPCLPNFVSSNFRGIISTSPLLRQSPGVKAPSIIVKLGSILGKALPNLPINAKVKPEDTCRDLEIQKLYAQDKLCKQQGTLGGVGSMLIGGESLLQQGYRDWPIVDDDKGLALLICHGESDKVTDCKASQEFVDKLNKQVRVEDASYKGFEGYYHEMQNEPGEEKLVFINFVIDWILSHSSQTSSTTTATPHQSTAPTTLDTSTPAIQVSPASPIVDDAAARESKL
jgi:acylglycerol lipase